MEPLLKLTKKQKKGIAFRTRKGKPSTKDAALATQDNRESLELPIMEDQDAAELEIGDDETQKEDVRHAVPKTKGLNIPGKGKDDGKAKDVTAKKRKRAEEDVEGKEVKRKKTSSGGRGSEGVEQEGEQEKMGEAKTKDAKNQRFILFLGNIKYTTTKEAIQEHFSKCDPPPTIRLLTPKPSASGKTTAKSKGCAFLEFTHRNALQQALKLHQSTLDGRMINVELTAGGGGKGDKRLEKLKERNKKLLTQRKDIVKKTSKDGSTIPTLPDKPQRFSTTSGVEQVPTTKRTWTVGDVEEDGAVHRGGKKHKKKEKRPKPPQATGVNAIPVG